MTPKKHTIFPYQIFKYHSAEQNTESAVLPVILIALCDTTTKIPKYITYFAEKYFKAHSNFKN